MPSRWEVTLPGVDPRGVKLDHLHAVVSTWFDRGNSEHHAQTKGYSITPLQERAGGAALEVALVDDGLVDRLLTHAAPGTRLRFGAQHTRLLGVPRQLAGEPWSGLRNSPVVRTWRVAFHTPTTFRRGGRCSPWPSPRAVLGALRATWQRFAPDTIGPLQLDLSTDPVWVTQMQGATDTVDINGRPVPGFVGEMVWECDGDETTARMAHSALRLAAFRGVGAYTTRGLGVIEVTTDGSHG